MGNILDEHHIYFGGTETEDRNNELIVIRDCHDEEGHGVYIDFPSGDQESFTTAFGYGPMAEMMADKFYEATVRFHEHVASHFDEVTDLDEVDFDDYGEWNDSWFKIVHKVKMNGIYLEKVLDERNESEGWTEGFQDMLNFMTHWGFEG